MWSTLWTQFLQTFDNIERLAALLGNFGQAITALIAGIALGFAFAQIRSAERGQKEATLNELNRDHNRASLDNPRFANPSLAIIDWTVSPPTFDGSADKFESYVWFMALGLCLHEHAHKTHLSNEWRPVSMDFFRRHDAILSAPMFKRHWSLYDYKLRQLWCEYSKKK